MTNDQPPLDNTDKNILALLDFNARMSYTDLGKKISKTKQYVRHRVERLKEKNIITGIDTVIDVTRLGFLYVRMLIRFSKTSEKAEEEMLAFFKRHKRTGWLVSTGGVYDMAAVIMVKTIGEYESVLDDFTSRFANYIAEVHTSIATRIWHFPHKILRQQPPHEQLIFGANPTNEELDAKDTALLRALYKNGSANSVQLGKSIGLSPAAVITRLRHLEKERIILAYRLALNTELLGYQRYKVFLTPSTLDEQFLQEFVAYCRDEEHIIYITKALGVFPLEFELIVRNNKEFNNVVKKLRSRFADAIRDVRFLEDYGTHIVSYTPF